MSKKIIVNGEEMEVEEEIHPIAQHFISQTTEEDLKSIYELKAEIEMLKGLLETKIQAVKEQNRGMENVLRGRFVAKLKTVSGRATTDWQRFVKDQIGPITGEMIQPYIKKSDDTVRLEVERIDG